jgi:exopolysaccharide production protein ExoZ
MLNLEGEVRPIHGVGWTLLHEMLFYYCVATALIFRRAPFPFCVAVLLSLWITGLFLDKKSALTQVLCSELNLLFLVGMFFGLIYTRKVKVTVWVAYCALGLGIFLFFHPIARAYLHQYFRAFDVGAILIVFSLLFVKFGRMPIFRKVLKSLGNSSYNLYLIHPILAPGLCVIFLKGGLYNTLAMFILVYTIVVIVAHIAFLFIERPLHTWFLDSLNSRINYAHLPRPIKEGN